VQAEAIAANPQKSDRAIARELGIGKSTVNEVRNSTVRDRTVNDQDETRIGMDGKRRRLPKGQKASRSDAAVIRGITPETVTLEIVTPDVREREERLRQAAARARGDYFICGNWPSPDFVRRAQ
jgi:hypothetical protein